ncbi:type II secretion system F family protein [Paludisphaera soli]|uniref:type II secretion system F family protein n=1 Tax=Paludisphaera soli TaxID=2712865 RepID=UPI0013E9DC3E|nr:type II secretion system F family protein [Paludisphaera soli]
MGQQQPGGSPEGGSIPPGAYPANIEEVEPWRLRHLLIVVFAVAAFFGAYASIGGWAVVLLIVLLMAAILGAVVVGVRGRAGQRYSLLWMLAIAADHGMPLTTTVEAFSSQYRGRFRRRVSRLAAHLGRGERLSDAMSSVRRLIPADLAMLVRMGEEGDRLGPTLRRAALMQADRSRSGATLASQAGYILGVFYVVQMITFFLLFYIVPKFEAIFNDFGVSLPPSTRMLINGGHFLTSTLLVPVWLPLLTLILMIVLPMALAGGLGIQPPLIGRLFPRRHAAMILRSLAITAEANRPIEAGLKTLARYYPVRWVRNRLATVAVEVTRGGDWRDALLRSGLVRPIDHEVLTSATAVGNLPWAMNDLADAIDRRRNLRLALLTQALWPIVILSVGALVLFLAIGFFTPLIELIGRLSG